MSTAVIGLSFLFCSVLSAQTKKAQSLPVNGATLESLQTKQSSLQSSFVNAPEKGENSKESILSKMRTDRLSGNKIAAFKQGSDSPKYKLQLVNVQNSAKADAATVVLAAGDLWGDGSGYQMLLDADANTYGTIIPLAGPLWRGNAPDSVYAKFEYKIPANADGLLTTTNIIVDTFGSVEIPGGIYDFCVPNPTAGDALWIAGGLYGRQDNFTFENGKTYTFEVAIVGEGDNVSRVYDKDLAVKKINTPMSGENLTNAETVKVSISNLGKTPINSCSVYYKINDGAPVMQAVNAAIAPQGVYEVVFDNKADFSIAGGKYKMQVWSVYEGDEDVSNDTMSKTVLHIGPFAVPFEENFNYLDNLEAWTIIDSNKDKKTWKFTPGAADDALGNPEGASIKCAYNPKLASDDYLITKAPMIITGGSFHIAFYYKASSYGESFDVLYGTSLTNMKKIDSVESYENIWQFHITNVTAPAGQYYIAFRATSHADASSISIDQVVIGNGKFVGVPDLAVVMPVLPYSSCGLTARERIGVKVANIGTEPIRNYTLKYVVNGGDTVSQEFTEEIGLGESKTVYFTQTADLSVLEAAYNFTVLGTCQGETNAKNNSGTGSVFNFTPTSVPFIRDLSKAEEAADWVSSVPKAWQYTPGVGCVAADTMALVSRCLTMAVGAYRIGYDYIAGFDFMGIFTAPDDFDVKYGKTGTAISTWTMLKSYKEMFTNGVAVRDEVMFNITEAGEYSFAFVPRMLAALQVNTVSVELVLDHDIRVNSISSSFAPFTPMSQATTSEMSAVVENRGKNAEAGTKITVKKGETVVGTSTAMDMPIGAIKILSATTTLSGLSVGENVTLSVVASMTNTDEKTSDNSKEYKFSVTDTVLAWENMTEFPAENGIGGKDASISLGYYFTLSSLDTLSAFGIAWASTVAAKADYTDPIGVTIYKVNSAGKIGTSIYDDQVKRGNTAGVKMYTIPARLLVAGKYFIKITQISTKNMGVCVDMSKEGSFYMPSGDSAVKVSGFGNAGVRLIFGKNAHLATKDVAVFSIDKPISDGLFAANQPIEATISNNSSDAITNLPVYCAVNKVMLNYTVASLPGYSKTKVTFTADMSTVGEYVIKVFTSLEGDEDRSNDTLMQRVNSVEPANPYIMDFEACADFAIDGFNPAWTTVDVDKAKTFTFSGITFPHSGEPYAFLALNPTLTKPAETGMTPQNGSRFGISMGADNGIGKSNDWLVSPKLKMGTASSLDFYVKSFTAEYGLEKYRVLLSTTNNEIASFKVLKDTTGAPDAQWTKVTIDLNEYNGKDIYLAFQCVSANAFIFMIDNIQVKTVLSNEKVDLSSAFKLYPNPANDMITIVSEIGINEVSVFNILGGKVYGSAKSLNTNNYRINVQDLKAGIYFARVSTTSGVQVLKFVVK